MFTLKLSLEMIIYAVKMLKQFLTKKYHVPTLSQENSKLD